MGELSPEEILQRIEVDERGKDRGKLKIFLGYCAGVGKTFHMLDIARDMLEDGKDIVVGYIEKHDRKETLALLDGMEILPIKEIIYKNIVVNELDVEGVIRRHPDIVIIDECAHTNVHGSKNEKRYQDIKEILEQGIDVYTTLNIQHIESLNFILKRITKVKVKEVVPDRFVRMADNIELIDIEPKELLNRIEEGKVYKKEKIAKAKENFFTLENLTRLRELALRYMTDSVEQRNIHEREEPIIVILEQGNKENNEYLVEQAKRMADYFYCDWEILESMDKSIIEKLIDRKKGKILLSKRTFLKYRWKFGRLLRKNENLDLFIKGGSSIER